MKVVIISYMDFHYDSYIRIHGFCGSLQFAYCVYVRIETNVVKVSLCAKTKVLRDNMARLELLPYKLFCNLVASIHIALCQKIRVSGVRGTDSQLGFYWITGVKKNVGKIGTKSSK